MRKTYKILLIIILIFSIKLILVNSVCYAEPAYIRVLKGVPTALKIGEELEVSVETNESYSNISCSVETKLSDYNKAEIKKSAGKYIISAKSAGTVKLTVTVKYYTRTSITATESATLDVNIVDPVQQVSDKIEDLENKANDADQTINDMKNAYRNIPDKNASAEEIDRFIKSDATFNDSEALNNITDEELLEEWEKTIQEAMQNGDYITRDMYKNTLRAIQERKNGDNVSPDTQGRLSEQFLRAMQASESTRDDYEAQVMNLIQEINGISRPMDDNFQDVLSDIRNYTPTNDDSESTELEGKVSIILTVITNIGMVLAILMVATIGIKYMLGSLEEKAEYKKDMIPYLIGAFLLFGITTIVKVLQQLGESINNI